MRKSFYKKIKNNGFTLVEMMVAVAVFSLVMVVAMSALINVIDANLKAQALKTAINNVNFALEGISKDMRMGSDYACGTPDSIVSISAPNDCTNGGKAIKYKSPKAVSGGYAYYYYDNNEGQKNIKSCIQKINLTECSNSSNFTAITSNEVDITNMTFYVIGAKIEPASKTQPRVVITLSGEAGTKDKIKTEFDLQTSVSQRTRK